MLQFLQLWGSQYMHEPTVNQTWSIKLSVGCFPIFMLVMAGLTALLLPYCFDGRYFPDCSSNWFSWNYISSFWINNRYDELLQKNLRTFSSLLLVRNIII
ncbi:hypothetical protein ACOSQ2_023308 [Xanthoceras sorbifolium]